MIVLTLDNRQIEEDNYKKVFYDVPKFKFFQCPIADGKYNVSFNNCKKKVRI